MSFAARQRRSAAFGATATARIDAVGPGSRRCGRVRASTRYPPEQSPIVDSPCFVVASSLCLDSSVGNSYAVYMTRCRMRQGGHMRLCTTIIALLLISFAPSPSSAWSVPSTGITQCYDTVGIISCPGEGELFFGQNGNYPGLAHTFVDNGDTAADQATSLVWQKTPDGVTRDWDAARAYCAELELVNR